MIAQDVYVRGAHFDVIIVAGGCEMGIVRGDGGGRRPNKRGRRARGSPNTSGDGEAF